MTYPRCTHALCDVAATGAPARVIHALRDQGGEVLTVYSTNGSRTAGAWSWQKDHIYRGTVVLAAALPGNVVHHLAVDHLGTPRAT